MQGTWTRVLPGLVRHVPLPLAVAATLPSFTAAYAPPSAISTAASVTAACTSTAAACFTATPATLTATLRGRKGSEILCKFFQSCEGSQ